jgi:Flp pilus assembly protein TadG
LGVALGKKIIMKKQLISRSPRQRGSALLIMVGLGMTGLLGFCALAADYGVLTNEANRLQRTVDAAALAGVSQLKTKASDTDSEAAAAALARKVAKENGLVDGADGAVFNTGAIQFNVASSSTDRTGSTMIRVTATRNTPVYFARIFGVLDSRITRTGTAQLQAVSRTSGVPLGITEETYKAYQNDTNLHELTMVRPNKATFERDDFVAFDLRVAPSSKSGAHFMEQLVGNEQEYPEIGQLETTLNSSYVSGGNFMRTGLGTLFQRSSQEPWRDTWTGDTLTSTGIRFNEILAGTAPPNNPRIINLIITNPRTSPAPGTFDTEIVGFAPVYVESYKITLIDGEEYRRLGVRFLPPIFVSDGQQTRDGAAVSGIRTMRLIDPPAATNWR